MTAPAHPPHAAKPLKSLFALGLAGLALSGAVAAVAISSAQLPPASMGLQEEISLPQYQAVERADAPYVREALVGRGETFSALLARLGVRDFGVRSFASQSENSRRLLSALRPGVTVFVSTTRDGLLQSLSVMAAEADKSLTLYRQGDDFVIEDVAALADKRLYMKSGTINSSLFAATDEIGLPDSVAINLAEIFAANIDFHRDLRRGDRFSVIYEVLQQNGTPIRIGRVVAADFINNRTHYSAIWQPSADGKGSYYARDGQSLSQGFLRSPLEFSRVSSGFSLRFHPILKQWRAHKGTDFAARTGTRIKATADGVVDFVGRQNGYGNLVVLRHQGNYSTAYGHLNGFAAGLRTGSKVSQGDIIGFVGSTGWATGPHLHYEFRVNGVQKDPMKVALPGSPSLQGASLARFRQDAAPLLTRLDLLAESAPQVAVKD